MTRSLLSTFLPAVLSVAALSSAASAHVQAFKVGGNLFIVGTNSAELLLVRGDSTNLFLTGEAGTLVNGQPMVSFTGIHGSILADFRGGNDHLAITDSDLEEHVVLLMGTGNDITHMARNTIAGSVLADGGLFGTYGDIFQMTGAVGEGSLIGGDAFVVARNLALVMRHQEVMGRTEVWSGPVNDFVTLAAGDYHGSVVVDTGGGSDWVALGDAADAAQNRFRSRLDVRLGDANDRLTVRRTTVGGQALLQGQAGSDSVESAAPAYGNVFQASLLFTGFETTL